MLQAEEAHRAGQFGVADSLCDEVLAAQPDHIKALTLKSKIASQSGKTDEAISVLSRLLQRHPDSLDALKGLSILLRREGDLTQAFRYAERAVQLNPEDPETHNNLGLCLQAQDRLQESVEAFKTALTLNDNLAPIHQNLGQSFQRLGRLVEARAEFQKACSLNPRAINPVLSLGNLLLKQGDYQRAIACGRQAVSLAPKLSAAHLLLAQALSAANAGDQAGRELLTARALEPANPTTHRLLGFHFQSNGEWDEAKSSFDRSLALAPRQGLPYIGLARGGDPDGSLLKRMMRTDEDPALSRPERSFLHYAIAKLLDDQAGFEEAMRHYDLANELANDGRFSQEAYAAHTARLIENQVPPNRSPKQGEKTPIFILGMMRSGTTLVEQILSSHHGIAAGGELRFWIENGAAPRDLESLAEGYEQELERIDPTRSYVTDKMPANFQMIGLIHAAFPQAKIIHVKRNPVANCLSIYTTPFFDAPDFAHNREHIVFAYQQYLQLMRHWLSILPSGVIFEVQYENLVEQPEPVVRSLLSHCGLPWDDACLAHETNGRLVNTPSVWQVRQPIYNSSVDRWRNYEPWLGAFQKLIPTAAQS